MTIEPPQEPSGAPDGGPELPRGARPSVNALPAILGLVLLIVLGSIEFA